MGKTKKIYETYMREKIFNLQEAIFESLTEIFHEDLPIYLTRHEIMPKKYILLEKIIEETDGMTRYAKFTAQILVITGVKQNYILSSVISRIKKELDSKKIETRTQSEIIGFYFGETFLRLSPRGYFEGSVTLVCFI